MRSADYPVTPDGRYFVVRGRLWRCTDPGLDPVAREQQVTALMVARRELRGPRTAEESAAIRRRIDDAKRALGERGPAWWTDGSPDFNRHLVKNSPYATWFADLATTGDDPKAR